MFRYVDPDTGEIILEESDDGKILYVTPGKDRDANIAFAHENCTRQECFTLEEHCADCGILIRSTSVDHAGFEINKNLAFAAIDRYDADITVGNRSIKFYRQLCTDCRRCAPDYDGDD